MFFLCKKVVQQCVRRKRFNARAVKLFQSPYRELRLNPTNVPYRYIYLNFMGPFNIKTNLENAEVWILVITCMWSRGINMKVYDNLTTAEFLRVFQVHCYECGVTAHCISDLGTQLTAGANTLKTLLNDFECQEYFHQHGIESFKFEHYFKGCSQLGSLVESCVQLTKKMIYSSLGKKKFLLKEFKHLVAHIVHISNRRPIALKNIIRQNINDTIPDPITPERLIHGRELLSLDLTPAVIHTNPDWEPDDLMQSIRTYYSKLVNVKNKINKFYNEEFLTKLMSQSIDKRDRYMPVTHQVIKPGDIVLLKEDFC